MDAAEQLRSKGLKVTAARQEVIKALEKKHIAYSHAELETIFGNMDRVTLYRVLNDFEQVGLVHKIIDLEGVTRFALCQHSCPGEVHADEHVHFNCESCQKIFCIDKVELPELKMPDGFKARGLHTLIYGLCDSCNAA
jgi:Fur family ferric uptake transcriptional regulator